MGKRILCAMLAALLLTGCAVQTQQPPVATTQPLSSPTAAATTTALPAPNQPEPETLEITQGTIDQTPGMVSFYLGDKPVYCGQSVQTLLKPPLHIHGDVDALVEPLCYSDEVRLRYPDGNGGYDNTLYLVAVNPTQEPLAVKDCLIYSLAINCEAGHSFGLGKNRFVTGQTTAQQILDAWGQPTTQTLSKAEGQADGENYWDMVYYQPLSYLQVIVRYGVVEQVRACHSAYLYPELAAQAPLGTPGESDALLHLSRHMDITPYLNGGKGGKTPLEMTLTIDGKEIQMGVLTCELPQPWRDLYQNAACIMKTRRCIYSQFPNKEGFIFGNPNGELMERFMFAQIKGVHAFNPNYTSWGLEQGEYLGFTYSGFDHNATIEDVINSLGQPYEIVPESGSGWCFVWLHFESETGDTLRLKVDPQSNQLIELRLEENSRFSFYP